MVVDTGIQAKTWHLPEKLLIKASPFFAAALNGSFAEATSRSVNLPEDDIDAFGFFVQWLYVGEITADSCIHTGADDDDDYHPSDTLQTFVQAWILGDKLKCPNFKDHAMLSVIRTASRVEIAPDDVRTAFEKSVSGSKLRKFLLDLVRYDARDNALKDDAVGWMFLARDCVDFGDDLMRTISENGDQRMKPPSKQKALYLEVLVDEDNGA